MKASARKYGRRRAVTRARRVLKSRAGQALTEFSLARPVLALIFLSVRDVGCAYHTHVAVSTPRALASSMPSKESTQLRYHKLVSKRPTALPSLPSPTLSPRPSMRLAQQAMTPTRLMRIMLAAQFYFGSAALPGSTSQHDLGPTQDKRIGRAGFYRTLSRTGAW